MNDNERLMLQKMIKANDVEDQSELIRTLKHSHPIQKDINRLLEIKRDCRNDQDEVQNVASQECSFLFKFYTEIFNKVKKDEIDLSILNRFLNILRCIEDGEIDQHEGSFFVGSILKELYVDSALRKSGKLEPKEAGSENHRVGQNIRFQEYKSLKMRRNDSNLFVE